MHATIAPGTDLLLDHPADLLTTLDALLLRAARLHPDAIAWGALRHDAASVLARAVGDGALPSWLTVGPDEPPAVVARTLAAARRRVARATG